MHGAGLDYITDLLARSIEEARLLEVRGRVTQITGTQGPVRETRRTLQKARLQSPGT